MTDPDSALQDLVSSNRILGNEGILDAFGHVTIRNPKDPNRFFMSRARAPELIEVEDILEFALDGSPIQTDGPAAYIERYIHGAIYEARADVQAICHNHAASILPFSIAKTPQLRAVVHLSGFIGSAVPIWDIATEFGDDTDMLVRTIEQGRSLASMLSDERVILMRGHGSVVVASDVITLTARAVALDKNARVQLDATRLGDINPLSEREIARILERERTPRVGTVADSRDWELWKRRIVP